MVEERTVQDLLEAKDYGALDALLNWGLEEIEKNHYETTRWSVVWEKVVYEKTTDKYYRFYKSVGATEYQDSDGIDFDSIEEVKPVKEIVEITKYKPVTNG